jgi:hypothetical protein
LHSAFLLKLFEKCLMTVCLLFMLCVIFVNSRVCGIMRFFRFHSLLFNSLRICFFDDSSLSSKVIIFSCKFQCLCNYCLTLPVWVFVILGVFNFTKWNSNDNNVFPFCGKLFVCDIFIRSYFHFCFIDLLIENQRSFFPIILHVKFVSYI